VAQLLITMRSELAKRYVKDRTQCDVSALLSQFTTIHIIGSTGICTRIKIDDAEIPALEASLKSDFIIEHDTLMLRVPGSGAHEILRQFCKINDNPRP